MAKYIHAALGVYGEDMGDIAISHAFYCFFLIFSLLGESTEHNAA